MKIFLASFAFLLTTPLFIQLDPDEQSKPEPLNQVKIFSYDGLEIKSWDKELVDKREISIVDFIELHQSDFAFSYNGDVFYFTSEAPLGGI